MNKPILNVNTLKEEAKKFSKYESSHDEPTLFGVTDGKAVGTYLEHKFQKYLHEQYIYEEGSSAKGIDFPELLVDIKVTSIKQPQSSCPFKSAKQKIYGLGYSLLIFVYEKSDNERKHTGRLNILHTIFVDSHRTSDFQTTSRLLDIINNDGNSDDIKAFFEERLLPIEEIQAEELASEILLHPPQIGYLTISNALQWRLQYSRVIQKAGEIEGIYRVI
ncbi:MAG: restriction endonuclease [Bacteroidales bacterium]|nr:restriction endonuclease [Bacteroidales bacterium]